MARSKRKLLNITFSADPALIKRARLLAREENISLNEAFRAWLVQFTRPATTSNEFDSVMKQLSHINAGKKCTRKELNEW
jgi:hypothetical protein